MAWNRCSLCSGIGVRFTVEWLFDLRGIRIQALREALVALVRKEIGPLATPDFIQWAPVLPKTRSGKIMRRILRKIADGDFDSLGDVSTLADPRVVKELIDHRIPH
ncbi:hypothetical protein [Paraburkholderia terrae]|uniref:AMP-binding enzyme n=1 Tax=Paraburkholderia terrae TaxID=311230 RepID=UPI0033658B9B